MKKLLLVLIVISAIFISACGVDVNKVISKISDEDMTRLSEAFVQCDAPYIRYGTDCCLDKNSNQICDIDEDTTPSSSEETTPEIVEVVTPTNCAAHFEEKPSNEAALCGTGGSIGDSPILDTYACKGTDDYPSASVCPAGMSMNNYYSYPDGTAPEYICYTSQTIGATSAPAGCPIASPTCTSGFTYDSATSSLSWTGSTSSWGCYYTCRANPSPYSANADWPCTKTGYKPIGGGGGYTCCAKY